MSSTYETDFYAWANEQAALLRAGQLGSADIENIAEEIESMGRSEKRELISRLEILLGHLLKWRYQPALRGRSWTSTIEEQREKLVEHMADNPSLISVLEPSLAIAYRHARRVAERETGLDIQTFPNSSPWTFEQISNEAFWPD